VAARRRTRGVCSATSLIALLSSSADLQAVDLELERNRSNRSSGLARLFRGGTEGNARLTAATAVVLLVLLATEGATVPFVRQQLTPHIFIGLLLIPPVLLKLASITWRFARYYLGATEYVAKGPPPALMRLLVAPLVVASTVGLFGTGVLLVLMHPQRGTVVGLHKASFFVWLAAMSAHVLGHIVRVPGLARADFDRPLLPGARMRQFLVAGAIVAGLIIATAGLPAAHAWGRLGSSPPSARTRPLASGNLD
jgi:hypothetical protein